MRAEDIASWASALFLLGMAGYVVASVGVIWAALHLGRRLDRIIELWEHDREPSA